MSLYTVILEFEGTTSVSQFEARNAELALVEWETGLTEFDAYGLTPDQAKRVAEALGNERKDQEYLDGTAKLLVALAETRNVWCHAFSVGAGKRKTRVCLINIIATRKR